MKPSHKPSALFKIYSAFLCLMLVGFFSYNILSTSPANHVNMAKVPGLLPTQQLSFLDQIVNYLKADLTGSNVIPISGANELDQNKQIIADLYPQVSHQDNDYATIPNGHYIRATFERNLTNQNDVTVYAKGNGTVEVYKKDSNDLITTFAINGEGWYDQLLTQITGTSSSFDLKFIGNISVDYIVDPTETTVLEVKGNLHIKGTMRINIQASWTLNQANCDALSGWYWYTTNGRSACWSKTLANSVSWNKGVSTDSYTPGAYTCATGYTLQQRMTAAAAGEWYKIVSNVNGITIDSSYNGEAGYGNISALAIADCLDGTRDLCAGTSCLGASVPAANTSLETWASATGNKSALPYCSDGDCITQAYSDYYDACTQNSSNDLPLNCLNGTFYKNERVCGNGDDSYNWAAVAHDPYTARLLGVAGCYRAADSDTNAAWSNFSFRVIVRP